MEFESNSLPAIARQSGEEEAENLSPTCGEQRSLGRWARVQRRQRSALRITPGLDRDFAGLAVGQQFFQDLLDLRRGKLRQIFQKPLLNGLDIGGVDTVSSGDFYEDLGRSMQSMHLSTQGIEGPAGLKRTFRRVVAVAPVARLEPPARNGR